MNRRSMLMMSTLGLLLNPGQLLASGVAGTKLLLVKDPNCGCCTQHAQYLRANGFIVEIEETGDLAGLRAKRGVPEALAGCHTILVDGYVIEGHVPASAVEKLLTERPMVKGISVPGMPAGSPGMDGVRTEPLIVYVIDEGMPRVFMSE